MTDCAPVPAEFEDTQVARILALREARSLLAGTTSTNPFGTVTQLPKTEDLCDLADYILWGDAELEEGEPGGSNGILLMPEAAKLVDVRYSTGPAPTIITAKGDDSLIAHGGGWIDEAQRFAETGKLDPLPVYATRLPADTGSTYVHLTAAVQEGHYVKEGDLIGVTGGNDTVVLTGGLGENILVAEVRSPKREPADLPFFETASQREARERTELAKKVLAEPEEEGQPEQAVATEEEIVRHAEKQGVSLADAWSHFEGLGFHMGQDVEHLEFNRTVPSEARD